MKLTINYSLDTERRADLPNQCARFQQALALQKEGQPAAAATICEEILRIQPKHVDALYLSGTLAVRAQDARRALEFFNKVIRLRSDFAEAYSNRGVVLHQLGRTTAALASLNRAIRLRPDFPEAHVNRGNVLRALGQRAAAVASYDRAIAIRADFVEAHFLRGTVLAELRQWGAALESYDRAIVHRPSHAEAYSNRGNVLQELGRGEEALASYARAIAIQPDFPVAFSNRGNVLMELRRWEEARASYEQAIRLDPKFAEAHSNLGNALKELLRYEEALTSYDAALRVRPDFPEAHANRGALLQDLGQLDAALASCDRAIAIRPDTSIAHLNRGGVLREMMQVDASVASYDRVIALEPGHAIARFNRATVYLLRGDFANGWREYEWRWRVRSRRVSYRGRGFSQPPWFGGKPIAGKTLLLHSEQGLGDTLQFCRYAPRVANLGARVILEVQRPLVSLLGAMEGVSQVVAQGDALPAFDYYCPLMSLPLAFDTSLSSIPAGIPYLRADPDKRLAWEQRLGRPRKLRVGIVWSGGFRPHQPELVPVNRRRNIPLAKLAALRHPDIEFFSLQKGQPAESELAELRSAGWTGPDLRDFTPLLQDFSDTAALLDQLDLVISVDTAMAHLAGALGMPVWILNRFDVCWRWLLDRADSPWYPTARLFRQERAGDWDGVVERVRVDLDQFARCAQ